MKSFINLLAIAASNFIEFFDFAVFAFAIPVMAPLFFPNSNVVVSYLNGFLVFALTFIVRPVGAIIFGYIGDVFGRRFSLFFSILSITIANFITAMLPTYEQVGIAATVFLITCRIIQGLSLGGESYGALLYVSESETSNQRAVLFTSIVTAFGLLGWLCSGWFTGYAISKYSANNSWRYVFVVAGTIGLLGFILRFVTIQKNIILAGNIGLSNPLDILKDIFSNYKLHFFACFGITSTLGAYFYFFCIMPNTLLPLITEISTEIAHKVALYCITSYMVFLPIIGIVCTRIKPYWYIVIVDLIMLSMAYPLTKLLMSGIEANIIFASIMSGFLLANHMAPMSYLITRIFPSSIAYTGGSLSYNLSMSIFGGLTPLLTFKISSWTGEASSSGMILIFACLLSLLSLVTLRKIAEVREG